MDDMLVLMNATMLSLSALYQLHNKRSESFDSIGYLVLANAHEIKIRDYPCDFFLVMVST